MVLYISTNSHHKTAHIIVNTYCKHASNALAWLGSQWESPLPWWSVSISYRIWVAKNTKIQICHWIPKCTCKSDNYTHSDTSILFHCQCPQLRSVYLKGRSLRRQNWLNWMECFSGLPNLPHSQVLLFEIKILIQEAGLPPDWPNELSHYSGKYKCPN